MQVQDCHRRFCRSMLVGVLDSSCWCSVLDLAHFSHRKQGWPRRGLQFQGFRLIAETSGFQVLSPPQTSGILQGFGFNLWNLAERLSHAAPSRISGQEEVCGQRQAAGHCLTYMPAFRMRQPWVRVLAHPLGTSGPG